MSEYYIQKGGFNVFYGNIELSPVGDRIKLTARNQEYDGELYDDNGEVYADKLVLDDHWFIEISCKYIHPVMAMLVTRFNFAPMPLSPLRFIPRRETGEVITFPLVRFNGLAEWYTSNKGEELFKLGFEVYTGAGGTMFQLSGRQKE